MKFLCWIFNHRLTRIAKSRDGSLERLYCGRCRVSFAMYHPCQYFGEWDDEDNEIMNEIHFAKAILLMTAPPRSNEP